MADPIRVTVGHWSRGGRYDDANPDQTNDDRR
jgi:hypothetical protein